MASPFTVGAGSEWTPLHGVEVLANVFHSLIMAVLNFHAVTWCLHLSEELAVWQPAGSAPKRAQVISLNK